MSTEWKKSGNTYRLFSDGVYVGFLKEKELSQMGLSVQDELTPEVFQEIHERILTRGKQKALTLLLHQDRSERELAGRLEKEGYTEEQTAQIMAYVRQFPYLDDVRYALQYIRSHAERSSRLKIRYFLSQKGVDDAVFDEAWSRYEEEYSENGHEEPVEFAAARAMLRRKLGAGRAVSYEERAKLGASLQRNGFPLEVVREVLKAYEASEEG